MKTIHIQHLPVTFRKGRTVLLKLEGNLILASGKEVRQLLLTILPDYRSVRIVLQQVEQIDLPFMQLIRSACNMADFIGENFLLSGGHPLRRTAAIVGISGPAQTTLIRKLSG
jgi:anti-anti-sigma regulatory factor